MGMKTHQTLDSRGRPFLLPRLQVELSPTQCKKPMLKQTAQLNDQMDVGDKIGAYSSLRHSFRDTAIAHYAPLSL